MKKYWPIIQDAIILVTVTTLFVFVCDRLFRGLKKTAGTDAVVVAINQNDEQSVSNTFSETEFKAHNLNAASFEEFAQKRANIRDDNQRTPLMWASYLNISDTTRVAEIDSKRAAIVDILIQKGANLNAQDEHGFTALTWASWSGLTKTAQRLIELGADITLADNRGNTPLMMAAQRGHTAIVEQLIARGASRMATTVEGKTAKDLAQTALSKYPERAETYQTVISLL
jgi:hypothetical protein